MELHTASYGDLERMYASLQQEIGQIVETACSQSGRFTPNEILNEETDTSTSRRPEYEVAQMSEQCRRATGFGEWADLIETKLKTLVKVKKEMDIKWENVSSFEHLKIATKYLFSQEFAPYQLGISLTFFVLWTNAIDGRIHPTAMPITSG